MTWEQKLAAIQALGEAHLCMRRPGDWYVSQSRTEVKERGSSVLSSAFGNGATPEEAVLDHWRQLAEVGPTFIVVIDAYSERRRHVRWNGYMWADEPVERAGVSA
jgi:hypothetical protein